MSYQHRRYRTNGTVWYALVSMGAYLALVVLGIHFAWDNAMRFGEPGVVSMEEPYNLDFIALYRSSFLIWCLLFLVLWLVVYLYYWNLGKSKEDQHFVRRCAKTLRFSSMMMMAMFYIQYLRYCFFGDTATLALAILQAGFGVLFLLSLVAETWRAKRLRKLRKRNEDVADAAPPTFFGTATTIMGLLSLLYTLLQLVQSIADILNFMNVIEPFLRKMFSMPMLPQPFVVRTFYDVFVMALPLIAIALLYLNLKYNAPPLLGDPPGFDGHPLHSAYTLATYPILPNEKGD